MPGTLTVTEQKLLHSQRPVRRHNLAWTSDAAGAVSGNFTDFISGFLERVVFIPGTGGSEPTALYDVTLRAADGLDLLAGRGANLSATVTTHVKPGVGFLDGTTTSIAAIAVDDKLELVVANAGNAKSGQVVLYVR